MKETLGRYEYCPHKPLGPKSQSIKLPKLATAVFAFPATKYPLARSFNGFPGKGAPTFGFDP
jgi:hypothetical protein